MSRYVWPIVLSLVAVAVGVAISKFIAWDTNRRIDKGGWPK